MSVAEPIKYPMRTRKKTETRRRIMKSTMDLVVSKGSARVTMADVAELADIHVTTLFGHFPNKAELFAAVTEPAIQALETRVSDARLNQVPFFEFLKSAQSEFAESAQSGGDSVVESTMFLYSQVELLPAWLRYERRQIELFADYLCTETNLSENRARLVAGMIVSANIFTYQSWLDAPTEFNLIEQGRRNTLEIEAMVLTLSIPGAGD